MSLASLRPRPRNGADFLDDRDLVETGSLEDHVELGLLFSSGRRSAKRMRKFYASAIPHASTIDDAVKILDKFIESRFIWTFPGRIFRERRNA